jgi:5-methylthioadenosine/S-adenosylhomocysteine deaminase
MCGFGFDRTMGEDMDFCGIATPAIMLAASRLSAVEMLRSGITLANVAGDAAAFDVARQTPDALGQAGMKAFVQTMLADLFGMIDMSAEAQLAQAEMLLREYQGKFEGRIYAAPGVGEALATSLKTMRRLAALAERESLIEHIHVFPRWPMGSFSWLIRGRSPLGLLKAGGLLNQRLIAVHFLAATRGDIAAVARAGASVVHCPSVWMNVNVGPRHWLPVKALHRAGVNIMLGTDSYGGWVEGADMFTEMRTCALMTSFLYGADVLKPPEVLRMATINGARALGLEKETGSLEVGKRADIVLLKFDRPPVQPASDVPAMIVYGASGRDVDTVLIDGRKVVRAGRLLTLDECEVLTAAAEARAELYRRGGWELTPDAARPPKTSWLERYPSERIAKWGERFARFQALWSRKENRQ